MARYVSASDAAFPMSSSEYRPHFHPGMSLRDWFAGQALAGIAAHGEDGPEYSAKSAYEHADAMLKERNKEVRER